MRKYTLVLLSLLIISCQDAFSPQQPELGEEFTLAFGKEAVITGEDLRIQFKDLLEDSRCPEGVQCVWAGNAKIAIQLNDSEVSLNTYLEPRKALTSDYQIELISVDPYPIYQVEVSKEDYSVRLRVTKN